MLQRIQTLFLLLAAVCMLMMFLFPLSSYLSDFAYYKLYIYGLIDMGPEHKDIGFMAFIPLIVLVIAVFALIVYSIFKFRKRSLQVQLINIAVFLNAGMVALIFFIYDSMVSRRISARPEYETGTFIPLIAIIFCLLAIWRIRKDEALVRSADRLR